MTILCPSFGRQEVRRYAQSPVPFDVRNPKACNIIYVPTPDPIPFLFYKRSTQSHICSNNNNMRPLQCFRPYGNRKVSAKWPLYNILYYSHLVIGSLPPPPQIKCIISNIRVLPIMHDNCCRFPSTLANIYYIIVVFWSDFTAYYVLSCKTNTIH